MHERTSGDAAQYICWALAGSVLSTSPIFIAASITPGFCHAGLPGNELVDVDVISGYVDDGADV